ncbi:MAG: GAF domain-containing protein [Anaerolineae bacterium]|nr:GAF domain-containing protein [Anaerolineae bacterium]
MSGTEPGDNVDQRIHRYMSAIERMIGGVFDLDLGPHADDALGDLGRGLEALAGVLAARSRELESLSFITEQLNAGLVLDDTLEQVFYTFRNVIPYNRIGFSLLVEEDGETMVRARWAKTDQPDVALEVGYQAPLAGSSLQHIVDTGEPRILNDLEAYIQEHPDSESTRLMLREGIRSSLTCPLIANGVCIGFMFFSSTEPNAYHQAHVRIFKQIAGELSLIVEKGRLVDRLLAKNAAIEAQNRQLHELNEMKNRFLGMAAHDLRNPLAVALSASQYLLEAGDAPSPTTSATLPASSSGPPGVCSRCSPTCWMCTGSRPAIWNWRWSRSSLNRCLNMPSQCTACWRPTRRSPSTAAISSR